MTEIDTAEITLPERKRPKVIRTVSDLLTPQQQKTLTLLSKGASNGEIAQELNCSIKTVEKHRQAVYKRIHVHDAVTATHWALRHNFITVQPCGFSLPA